MTRCGPARTWIGSVSMTIPCGSDSDMNGSISSSATRAPSIDTSIFSSGAVIPYRNPVGPGCMSILNTYSPSAGKTWMTEIPPRVPKGAPSARTACDAVFGTL